MRRRGEPQRKNMRRESPGENKDGRNKLERKVGQDEVKEQTKKMEMHKPGDEDGKEEAKGPHHGKIGIKEMRLIKAERRERRQKEKRTKRRGKANNRS